MNRPDYETILFSMKEKYVSLTKNNPDDASDIGIRLKVLAVQLDILWNRLEEIEKQTFPETAEGIYLDYHAMQRGLERKKGTCSKGVLRFSRQTPASYDIIIPKGRICQTLDEIAVRVQTTADVVLKAGQLYVDCDAQAVDDGFCGNLAANTVDIMVNPPQGISSVINSQAFCGGTDQETDEQLRLRVINSYKNVSNGANCAYYMEEALKFDGITSAAVLPTKRGAGTVDVVVSEEGRNPASSLIAQMQTHFNKVREIGVDVKVLVPQEVRCDFEIEISPAQGVMFNDVRHMAEQAVREHIKAIRVGQPLFMCALGRAIFDIDDVYNYRIKAPSADKHILPDQIIRCGSVTITEMAVV